MSILIGPATKVVVQGATGRQGTRQLSVLQQAGHPAVAGVSPGRGGETLLGTPLFDSVAEAVQETGCNATILHVPPAHGAAMFAGLEAVEAGISVISAIPEGIPVHEATRLVQAARLAGAVVIGPNGIGAASPGQCLLGMIATSFTLPGPVGVVSRSGTLTLETHRSLTAAGLGQSTIVSMGGDPVVGLTQGEYLTLFDDDPDTHVVVLIGEPGGTMESQAAALIPSLRKPVVVYVAGLSAPEGKRMGHLGALMTGGGTSAAAKADQFRQAGAVVVESLWDIVAAVGDLVA